MIVELAAIAALLVGGMPLAAAFGVRGPSIVAVGLVVGSALHVGLGVLPVLVGVGVSPTLVLFVTAGVGLLVAGRTAWIRSVIGQPGVIGGAGAALGLVIVLWRWGAVNLTQDSFRYVTTGALLADGKLGEASEHLLLTRGLAVPMLHAPANLGGEFHLRSLTPLFAIATVMILLWAIRRGLRDAGVDQHTVRIVQVVAALLLVSVNRFVFHAFYVNGHLFIAGWLLLLAGSIWVERDRGRPTIAVTVVRGLLVIAIVLARPDGALLAGLALVPLLVQRRTAPVARFVPLLVLGAATFGWNLTIARRAVALSEAPFEVLALLVLGATLVLAGLVLLVRPQWLPARFSTVIEVVLWAVVLVASVQRPDILRDSVRATVDNTLLGSGGWGVSLGVLGVLVLLVLALSVDPGRHALRFPVTVFVPFSLLLAFLREGAYRVGPGDSLNRMLIHIVPLAILLLASAVAASRWRRPVVPDAAERPATSSIDDAREPE